MPPKDRIATIAEKDAALYAVLCRLARNKTPLLVVADLAMASKMSPGAASKSLSRLIAERKIRVVTMVGDCRRIVEIVATGERTERSSKRRPSERQGVVIEEDGSKAQQFSNRMKSMGLTFEDNAKAAEKYNAKRHLTPRVYLHKIMSALSFGVSPVYEKKYESR